MYQLDEEPMETLHVYVYREEEQTPQLTPRTRDTILSIITILVLIAGIIALSCIPNQPNYTVKTISVPAIYLPLQTYAAKAPIIFTGTTTTKAISATGTLTIYNGSILTQQIPRNFILTGTDGSEVVTDDAVTIPPGNAPAYGIATVPAHVVIPGAAGNIRAYDINAVYGTDLTIKNLTAFTGGKDAVTTRFATASDRVKALTTARNTAHERIPLGLLTTPCTETTSQTTTTVTVSFACQFVRYDPPSQGSVITAIVRGKTVVLTIKSVVHTHPFMGK